MASSSPFRCPHCRERVVQKSADGVKVRTTIIVFRDDGDALIKCRKCKGDLLIQAALGDELRKALEQPPRKVVVRIPRKSIDSRNSAG